VEKGFLYEKRTQQTNREKKGSGKMNRLSKRDKSLIGFFKTEYRFCKVENDNFNMHDFYCYLRSRNDYFLECINEELIDFNVINPFNVHLLTIEELEFYIAKVEESDNVLKMLSKTFTGMEKKNRINLDSISDKMARLKCYLIQNYIDIEREANNE
jgi:hypothetical protein